MKNNKFLFYRNFILLFLTISFIIYLLPNVLKIDYPDESIWIIQAFFFVITILSHMISEIGLRKKSDFHLYYMMSMSVRFFLSLIFILVYLFISDGMKLNFVVNFFILYFAYTSFEIYFLLRNLRLDSKNEE